MPLVARGVFRRSAACLRHAWGTCRPRWGATPAWGTRPRWKSRLRERRQLVPRWAPSTTLPATPELDSHDQPAPTLAHAGVRADAPPHRNPAARSETHVGRPRRRIQGPAFAHVLQRARPRRSSIKQRSRQAVCFPAHLDAPNWPPPPTLLASRATPRASPNPRPLGVARRAA